MENNKKYVKPLCEIVAFNSEDVIFTSATDRGTYPGDWGDDPDKETW